ncbi:hypothetical protein BDC45DRAFT_569528 [Circinella umbellata]|nr:hypothetical protein BDC45DRAFT_569528 [Circinella umbellata]
MINSNCTGCEASVLKCKTKGNYNIVETYDYVVSGLSVTIRTLSLTDKKFYLLQEMAKFTFPRTLKDIRKGGIDKVFGGLNN